MTKEVSHTDTMTLVDLFTELRDSVSEERRILASGTDELIKTAQKLIDISSAHNKAAERSLALIKQITETLTREVKK